MSDNIEIKKNTSEEVNMENQVNVKNPRLTVNAREIAKFIGISYWSVLEMCKRGEIPYIPVGKKKLFRLDSIEQWLTLRESSTIKKDLI
ncbi:MAG: helix-turn-helix domain-containing protein [Candidatus Wallbacteria bacterium]